MAKRSWTPRPPCFGTAAMAAEVTDPSKGDRTSDPRSWPTAVGLLAAIALGGMLGLGWWLWRRRRGVRPPIRFRRGRGILAAACLAVLAVGSISRLAFTAHSVPACSPPGGTHARTTGRAHDAWLVAEEALTWPETGLGMLYARSVHARVCLSLSAHYYVAVPAGVAGTRATNMGDIVLSPGFQATRERRTTLALHEAKHRPQWALGTMIGGPLMFPLAYALDNFFFPGARNHFERQAGLEAGGYLSPESGPVLGHAQVIALTGFVGITCVFLCHALYRRRFARSRNDTRAAVGSRLPRARDVD